MAVARIEEYRQKDGVSILKVFCKPTAKFPEGKNFFYAPAEAIDLVQRHTWYLNKKGSYATYVCADVVKTKIYFQRELLKFYHGEGCVEPVSYINLIGIDNADENLRVVTTQQSRLNRFTRGYACSKVHRDFTSRLGLYCCNYYPLACTHQEDEVCIQQNYLEQVNLRELLGDEYYKFDFLKYRRGSENILDLERTGIISEEEAVYRHILGYAENAWYYLRFGLQDYFRDNNIPVPSYTLDAEGFMIHPVTGKRLCPFYKGGN